MKKYIDLGLPSGTMWASDNEEGYYTCDKAVENFGNNLPNREQFEELKDKCQWKWESDKKGYKITGKNGNSIFLPTTSCHNDSGSKSKVDIYGFYSSPSRTYGYYYNNARSLYFDVDTINIDSYKTHNGMLVRLVKNNGNYIAVSTV